MTRVWIWIIALTGSAAAGAQDVYVDQGACPGEGCAYGQTWVIVEPVPLRESPELSAPLVRVLQPGEILKTQAGEVHTLPGEFVVHRATGEFAPGDEVLVYTYLGEGWFRIRHNGAIKEAELGFSPWGGTGGSRCADSDRCWGTLSAELSFDWWVFGEAGDGTRGWSRWERGIAPIRGSPGQ